MGNLEGSDYKIAKQQHYDKTTNYNNLFNYLKSNIKSCTEETSEILFFFTPLGPELQPRLHNNWVTYEKKLTRAVAADTFTIII